MSFYYRFYNPNKNFDCVNEGSFAGIPFYDSDCPIEIPMAFEQEKGYGCYDTVDDIYNCTGLLNREKAQELQKYMDTNNTLFTDMMDENNTDVLIFRIN